MEAFHLTSKLNCGTLTLRGASIELGLGSLHKAINTGFLFLGDHLQGFGVVFR
jgi:hypothetical protein